MAGSTLVFDPVAPCYNEPQQSRRTLDGLKGRVIGFIPHPFGIRTRDELRQIAGQCADDIARLVCESGPRDSSAVPRRPSPAARATLIEAPDGPDEINKLFFERGWSDGLPVVPPTAERVARMLRHTRRGPDEVVATIAPAFGAATVERIAINAVLAGCYPEYLPVLIAAAEAVAVPEFNLQAIQVTTNPAAVWLVINGPIARQLEVNSGGNCLGPGAWANATLGRALRLILQNIGGALPREMDRATQGQPGKYTFCCAELGEIGPDTLIPISARPEHISIIVAGGPGTHSVYVPVSAHTRSVTREVVLSG